MSENSFVFMGVWMQKGHVGTLQWGDIDHRFAHMTNCFRTTIHAQKSQSFLK